MINILFYLWTTTFNGPNNGVVHTLGVGWQLSYLKYHHGDRGGGHNGRKARKGQRAQRVHKDSNGRSKETYKVFLDNGNW